MSYFKNITILLFFVLSSKFVNSQCCGNGICEPGETAINCPYDCATSSFNCPNTIGSFFSSPTWPINSSTAQTNGWCYTLTPPYPSQVCFEYIVPNVGDSTSVSFVINACGGSSINQANYPPNGGCNNAGFSSGSISGASTYDNNCALVSNFISTGGPGCYNPGEIVTICLDINPSTTCSQITICPVIACGQTNCATSGTSTGCPPFNFTQNNTTNPCDSTNGIAIVTPFCGDHFSYLWDDTLAQTDSLAFGLAPGSYNVIITNTVFGCDTTIMVVIPNNSSSNTTQINQSICQGDSIFLGGSFQSTIGIYNDTIATSGCDSIIETTLTVNSLPTIIANPNTTNICSGNSVNINATGGINYFWNNGLGAGQNHTVSPTVNTIYIVTGTDANNCSDTSSVIVSVILNTLANAGNNQDLCDVFTTNLNANAPLPLETGVWNILSGSGIVNNPNDPNSSVSNLTLGSNIFVWNITNATCPNSFDSVTITITVCEPTTLLIPNVFTPNGDGSNDIFTVNGVNLNSLECEIYNRWGQFLYAWNGIKAAWDGRTTSGSEVPDGTYFYILKATGNDGEEYLKKGSFSLIR